jgi:hypothetical protein
VAEKVRLRRKDLKRPDEFVTATRKAIVWGREHQTVLTWVGGAAVAAIALVGILAAYRAARERDANADLARAMALLGADQFAAASTELKEVSTRWSDTQVGPLARLLAANAALSNGDADGAIAELVALEPNASALPPYLHQQMLFVWGAALEGKQQWVDAAVKYQAAAAQNGPYTSDAMVSEARTRERAGETDRAKELYRQVYDQFPDLPDRDRIGAKVKL